MPFFLFYIIDIFYAKYQRLRQEFLNVFLKWLLLFREGYLKLMPAWTSIKIFNLVPFCLYPYSKTHGLERERELSLKSLLSNVMIMAGRKNYSEFSFWLIHIKMLLNFDVKNWQFLLSGSLVNSNIRNDHLT